MAQLSITIEGQPDIICPLLSRVKIKKYTASPMQYSGQYILAEPHNEQTLRIRDLLKVTGLKRGKQSLKKNQKKLKTRDEEPSK